MTEETSSDTLRDRWDNVEEWPENEWGRAEYRAIGQDAIEYAAQLEAENEDLRADRDSWSEQHDEVLEAWDEARAERDQAIDALASAQWSGDGWKTCPVCHGVHPEHEDDIEHGSVGHKDSCPVSRVLREVERGDTVPAQPLFQSGNFELHSGGESTWKVECDALTSEDYDTLARLIANRFTFGDVVGIPTGGTPIADALEPHTSEDSDVTLLVDDVLTTGNSMEEHKPEEPCQGVVLFARGPCPDWVWPLWRLGDTVDQIRREARAQVEQELRDMNMGMAADVVRGLNEGEKHADALAEGDDGGED